MALPGNEKTIKSCASFDLFGAKSAVSRSSIKSKIPEPCTISKKFKRSTSKNTPYVHSITTDGINFNKQIKSSNDDPACMDKLKRTRSFERNNKSEIYHNKMEEDKYNDKLKAAYEEYKASNNLMQSYNERLKIQKKLLEVNKRSDTFSKILEQSSSYNIKKTDKIKESMIKRPTEIPKLKSISDTKKISKINMTMSKLPVKTIPKEPEQKQSEASAEELKNNSDSPNTTEKLSDVKKSKKEEKAKEAMKKDFAKLVPLYQKELKKVTDVWINAIYASLMMRTNLVKLLYQTLPYIDKTQLQTEDDRLLYCIAHAKNNTKSEAEALILFIKSLMMSQEKLKEDYTMKLENKKIAETYNYDWRELTRKIAELGEEIKRLQIEISEILKKKEEIEATGNEKIQKLEHNLLKKKDEIQKVSRQLEVLRQRENSCKGNVFLNVEDYKEIKEDVLSLQAIQKEYEELKAKYMYQNDVYEKKIKDLETLLEEKKNIFEREKGMKKQLQSFLDQLQAQQKHLTTTIGKEQLDYVLGRLNQGRDKRLEQLWVVAVKLVLKGFLIQIKKLEKDRNKMLLELHSNNSENFNAFANTLIQKDNFIESMKLQMKTYYNKASIHANTNNLENSSDEYQKN